MGLLKSGSLTSHNGRSHSSSLSQKSGTSGSMHKTASSANSLESGNDENDSVLDDIDETDEGGQNIILGIVSQLKPGSDLSRITLPTFILERKSMLERITNQLQQPDFVLEAHSAKESIDRFLGVVKWYLSGWHIAPKAVKKPLNPVLGEYFTCYWDLPNKQQAFYISEQTSHHPPKSSYFYMIPESNIRVDGVVFPKSKFLGNSSAAMMEGLGVLQFLDIIDPKTNKPEKYTFTQPNVYARGILFGKMRIELGDHMIIKGPQYQVDIDFKTKGFISGTYDAIEGSVKDYKGKTYYEISGKWNDIINIKDTSTGKKTVFLDVNKTTPLKPKVRPLREQGQFESRNLWRKVLIALGKRDHTIATNEKFKIEEHQRELAKTREDEDLEFQPKLFKKSHDPKDDLEYYIYRDIPQDADSVTKVKSILEIAPILPGQDFTEKFEIPAYKKNEIQKQAAV